MTLREKAKEMYGDDYVQHCPSQLFGIACFADNSYPDCHDESCWKFHQTDKIEFKDKEIEHFRQQLGQ